MLKFVLSFIPYSIIFLLVYGYAGIHLFKKRYLKTYDDLWIEEKQKLLSPAPGVAFTVCVVYCAGICIYSGHLTPADRIFAFCWGIWSVYAHGNLRK